MIALLLGLLFLLFLANAPIAVAIGAAATLAFSLGSDASLMLVAQRMYAGADSFPLMAVPLFMLAGELMDAGGLSRRIIALAEALVGWLPGGLAAAAVVAAMFFAGVSGSAAADALAVGASLAPAMIRGGYPRDFTAGVLASAGSIGVVIPPSIPMIIFGVLTGASIGKLFAAGVLPGVCIGASLIGVASLISGRRGYGGREPFAWARVWRALPRAVWALGAPVIILGGILGGVFTATESAAVAVIYALGLGLFVFRELSLADLPRLATRAAITSSVILFIISQATVFSWLLAVNQAPERLGEFVLGLSRDPVVLLLLVNLLLLVTGAFLETTAALILFVPVILPMLPSLGIETTHLGIIVVVNLAIGMLTPPLGVCCIVTSGLTGAPLMQTSRAALPFLAALLLNLLLLTFWPGMTLWLPSVME